MPLQMLSAAALHSKTSGSMWTWAHLIPFLPRTALCLAARSTPWVVDLSFQRLLSYSGHHSLSLRLPSPPGNLSLLPRYAPKAGNVLAQAPEKNADGRDRWPSRAALLLAAMGGCVGQGNPLRYPSVDYSNHELQ